jgi:signal transduction histidine kinase
VRLNARWRGLQFEIVSSLFVVMLAGVAVIAMVMALLGIQTVERAAIDRMRLTAAHFERLITVGDLRLVDLSAVVRTSATTRAEWTLFDAEGREIGTGPGRAPDESLGSRFVLARGGGEVVEGGATAWGDLIFVASVQTLRGERGFLVGNITGSELLGELRPLLGSGALMLGVAAAVFVVFGATLLHGRIVLRVRDLSLATRAIAAGDLSARTEPDGEDELADLARNFNQMAQALQVERRALIAATDSLDRSQRLATIGQLAAGVAHEVGNPVAAILGYAEVSLRDPELGERSRHASEAIRSEALRIRSLVRDLLDLARSEQPTVSFSSPDQLLDRTCRRMEPQKLLDDIELTRERSAELPQVRTDPRRVEQVLVNLVENAAHALSGRDAASIVLSAHPAHTLAQRGRRSSDVEGVDSAGALPDAVALCVTDNGPGIDPTVIPHVFDPFFTTKDPGVGTGLGLWNCHRVAEQLGGRLDVESAPGRTRFSLVLPTADTTVAYGTTSSPDHR